MILLATALSFLHTDDGLVLVFDDDPVFCGLDLSLLAHVPDIATGVGIGILEPVTNRAFTEWSPFFWNDSPSGSDVRQSSDSHYLVETD